MPTMDGGSMEKIDTYTSTSQLRLLDMLFLERTVDCLMRVGTLHLPWLGIVETKLRKNREPEWGPSI